MSDWIPATRESAGYYADDPPKRYPPTCRERQDAAITDLRVSAGYAQAANDRLTRRINDLAQRVAVLEALLMRAPVVGTVVWDTGAVTWTGNPPPLYTSGYPQEETL